MSYQSLGSIILYSNKGCAVLPVIISCNEEVEFQLLAGTSRCWSWSWSIAAGSKFVGIRIKIVIAIGRSDFDSIHAERIASVGFSTGQSVTERIYHGESIAGLRKTQIGAVGAAIVKVSSLLDLLPGILVD